MIVGIERGIFDNAITEERKMQLSFLLYLLVHKTCYALSIQDDVSGTSYYKDVSRQIQDVINEAFSATITTSVSPDCLVGIGYEKESELRRFSLQEALEFLMEPSSIILENSLNDSYFVDALIKCYDTGGILREYTDNGWLRYDNAGGCGNVQNFLQARVNHYQGKTKFLKHYVILDSDKLYEAHKPHKYDGLEKKLKKWGIGYHILEKRAMENYMPLSVLNIIKGKKQREWVAAYVSLSPRQRDFMCISSGFCNDVPKSKKELLENDLKRFRKSKKKFVDGYFVKFFLQPNQKAQFVDVSNGNFVHLSSGFPEKGVFKEQFPKRYLSSMISAVDFDLLTSHQDNVNELKDLVAAIHKIM